MFFILWIWDINIYIVNTGALFFFSLGYYIVKYNINYRHIDNIKFYDILFMYFVTIVTRLFFSEYIRIIDRINIIVGILFFIKASSCFIKSSTLYNFLNWLKDYSFFVYAIHLVVEAVLIKLSVLIIPMNGGWLLVQYFGVSFLTIILLVIIGMLLKKMLPRTYGILTGGRV
jgi:hypothetical protein